MSKRELNVHKFNKRDKRGPALCPMNNKHPFSLDDVHLSTIEGWMLLFRLPPNDKRRVKATMGNWKEARSVAGRLPDRDHGWWNGKKIKLDSKEFRHLFERMMRRRFRDDHRAIAALMSTRGTKFVHRRPKPNSPLSVVDMDLYFKILRKFRRELFEHFKILKPAAV